MGLKAGLNLIKNIAKKEYIKPMCKIRQAGTEEISLLFEKAKSVATKEGSLIDTFTHVAKTPQISQVEMAELGKVEEQLKRLLTNFNSGARNVTRTNIENILSSPEDRITLLSYFKKNPEYGYLITSNTRSFPITTENIRLLRELKPLLSEGKIEMVDTFQLLENSNIAKNLDCQRFMEFVTPFYKEGRNLAYETGTGNKQALEVIAEYFSRPKEEFEKVKYLLDLWKKNPKEYPLSHTTMVMNAVEEWENVMARNLMTLKKGNGQLLHYGEIDVYSKLTNEEWASVLNRKLLNLEQDFGKHFSMSAVDMFNIGENQATYLARLSEQDWQFVLKNNLLQKYNGYQISQFMNELSATTRKLNGKEKSLLEIAMERGIISAGESKIPVEAQLADIEALCNIENWHIIEQNKILEHFNYRDFIMSAEGELGQKIQKLSKITSENSWARINEHNLWRYNNVDDIITLTNLDSNKFRRFTELHTTLLKNYNAGIGELAALDDNLFQMAQRDLFGKVQSASSICKLLKLNPKEYEYVISHGLLKDRELADATVDLIVNMRKFIGKKELSELYRSEKRELLSLLLDNKQNFEASKFCFSQHEGSLPILKGEYKSLVEKVVKELGIHAENFAPQIQTRYFGALNSLLKTESNVPTVLENIADIAPNFKFLNKYKEEITSTINKIKHNPRYSTLSESDKKVLLTSTLLEKCSEFSLVDAAFDANILARRLGFSNIEINKISNIIKNSNLISDFMKVNKGTVSVKTPAGVVLEGEARKLQLDRIAFSLKESNTFDMAQMLYSTKEKTGLSRNLDKIIAQRIQEIKANDFVLPQFSIKSWVKEMSKDAEWLKRHTSGGRLIIYQEELPQEYIGFVHCIDNAAATGGSAGSNLANFDLFSALGNKVGCTSYVNKSNWGTFGNNGVFLTTGNSGQLVGTGHDLWSWSKDTDGVLMEYYRDMGLLGNQGKTLKFNHRTSISDSLKEILYGKDYKGLREAGNIEEMRIIDTDYISRIDRLKTVNHPISLDEIKEIDNELYNAYVEYLARLPKSRLDEQALLRNNWHNEVLLKLDENTNIDGFMIKAKAGVGSVYDANANVPHEFFELTEGGKIPLVICK